MQYGLRTRDGRRQQRQGERAHHKHVAASRLRKTGRAGGRIRNCEEKVRRNRERWMPEGRRAGDLAQARVGRSSGTEPGGVSLGVLSGPAKELLRRFDADRGGSKPCNYPSRSTEPYRVNELLEAVPGPVRGKADWRKLIRRLEWSIESRLQRSSNVADRTGKRKHRGRCRVHKRDVSPTERQG
jgi:hypothetical protein